MKATGIVRRIDDLGRVMIPKEIRKSLRIKEGDPLEVFTDGKSVIYKKYKPMSEISDFAPNYVESLHEATGYIAIIVDKDNVVAVSGMPKAIALAKNPSESLIDFIEARLTVMINNEVGTFIPVFMDSAVEPKVTSQAIATIVSEGEPVGAVILLSTDPKVTFGNTETVLVKAAARFIGRNMEVY